ncbi:hypothetical protein HPB50_000293 [Hyalomma asiaticum]|uniref:Uncharacterized protein n=1 Tax=Hyalomma asiaticum TaxID=266040 RepID=A0ACB7RTS9_HYAAI|nr:hypothetical protein HPB50_000293 [Hyalomma asiaticum]
MIGNAMIRGEVCSGVITGHHHESSPSLRTKIHSRGGNFAFIRKLGKTSIAFLIFDGHRVPRFLHYKRRCIVWSSAATSRFPILVTRLRHLLTSEELGDRRPSRLVNTVQQLLRSNDVDSNGALFRELFLQRLPQSTRLVLAAAGELTLDRLAHLADRVHDATSATVTAYLQHQNHPQCLDWSPGLTSLLLPSTPFGHPP